MNKTRLPEAIWNEKMQLWRVSVQRNGVRKIFSSAVPGRKGKHIAENKADDWIERGAQDMHLNAAWQLFLEEQLRSTSRSNYAKHESAGRIHILPVLGSRKLSALTPVLWQSVITKASETGLSRRSLINIRSSITSFLHYARRARWDVEQLIDGDIRIPNSAAPQKQKVILQPDDIRKLFSVDTIVRSSHEIKAHYIYAFRFIVITGLRRGELCGLRTEDITDTSVTIRRSINTLGETTNGKNDNARRTFLLTPIAAQLLRDQHEYLRSLGIISPWIFPDESGAMTDPNRLYDRWRAFSQQHGFRTSLHELRHTFISLGKADLPLELMKAVVGHSTSMDTYGIYGHTVEGEAARAAAIMQNVFDNILHAE